MYNSSNVRSICHSWSASWFKPFCLDISWLPWFLNTNLLRFCIIFFSRHRFCHSRFNLNWNSPPYCPHHNEIQIDSFLSSPLFKKVYSTLYLVKILFLFLTFFFNFLDLILFLFLQFWILYFIFVQVNLFPIILISQLSKI